MCHSQVDQTRCKLRHFGGRGGLPGAHRLPSGWSSHHHSGLLPMSKPLAKCQGFREPFGEKMAISTHVIFQSISTHVNPKKWMLSFDKFSLFFSMLGATRYGAAAWNFGRAPGRPVVLCQHRAPRGGAAVGFESRSFHQAELPSKWSYLLYIYNIYILYHTISYCIHHIVWI